MMARLATHRFHEMISYTNNYWRTYIGTFIDHKEHIRLAERIQEKISEIKWKDLVSSNNCKEVKKLLTKHQEYQGELVEDMDQLDKEDTKSLPTVLNEDDGSLIPHEQWKEILRKELPKALDDINDEENMLDNKKIIMIWLYKKEYIMRHFVSNIETYKE